MKKKMRQQNCLNSLIVHGYSLLWNLESTCNRKSSNGITSIVVWLCGVAGGRVVRRITIASTVLIFPKDIYACLIRTLYNFPRQSLSTTES